MKSLIVILALALPQDDGRGGKIEWTKDLEAGLKEARKAGKPVMIYFTADW